MKTDAQVAQDSYLQAVRIKLQKKGLSPEAIEVEVNKINGVSVEVPSDPVEEVNE